MSMATLRMMYLRSAWCFALMCCGMAVICAQDQRPNVIVVLTDDQGYGEFSCHGNPLAQTPHIDALAAQSFRFEDFHVAPMCTPTRGQFMTGLDAFRNRAINVSSGRTLLRTDVKTIADHFRAAGYRTGLFGKWHLGDNYPYRPQDRGFDTSLWFPSSHINSVPDVWDNDYFNDTYIVDGQRKPVAGYCTDVFFREAITWMEDPSLKKPFFTFIPLNAAHAPYWVPEPYRDIVRAAMGKNPAITQGLSPTQIADLTTFLAMGANIDENMGRLEESLQRTKQFDNTIVVFFTDNGSTLGEIYYNAGMRGKKTTMWEGGHRVPCFIRCPTSFSGQPKQIHDLTQVQDLLPTLLDIAGLPPSSLPLDGLSLAPLMRGQQTALPDRNLVINYSRMPKAAVDQGDASESAPRRSGAIVLWKTWRLLDDQALYDIASDPHQDRNVIAEHPAMAKKLRSHLDNWWNDVRDEAMKIERIIIGAPQENPMLLTACDWLNVFVDQQRQIRQGVKKNGTWHLIAQQSGRYTFEMRRWPRESALRLQDAVGETTVTDGILVAGKALPISAARIRIGAQELMAEPSSDGTFLSVTAEISAGPLEIQTWMLDSAGQPLCGAYYLYVERLP